MKFLGRVRGSLLMVGLLAVLATGCNSIQQFPVNGRIGMQPVDTKADSELARYYIQHDQQLPGLKPDFDSTIKRLHNQYDPQPLTSETLKSLTTATSPDFATVYFARRILMIPANLHLQETFAAHVERFRANDKRQAHHFQDRHQIQDRQIQDRQIQDRHGFEFDRQGIGDRHQLPDARQISSSTHRFQGRHGLEFDRQGIGDGHQLRDARRISSSKLDDYIVVFVPGLFYERKPENKADMAEPRAVLKESGLDTRIIRVLEAGTVEENGERIAAELLNLRNTGKKIIIVSSSKGGPEVAYALGVVLADQDMQLVQGWVSIGGVLRGSPLADANLEWPRRWLAAIAGRFAGFSLEMVRSISTQRSLLRFDRQTIPRHVKIIHFVGVPLAAMVMQDARSRYLAMRELGPNDGVTLLADELLPSGGVILAIGSDHWFRDPEISIKSLALSQTIIDLIEK